MSYGIGTFARASGEAFPGMVLDGRVRDLRTAFGEQATVLSILNEWDAAQPRLDALAVESGQQLGLSELRLLPRISPPGAFLCAGANYRLHIIEMRTANAVAQGLDGKTAEADAVCAMDERAANGIPFVFAGWPGSV